MFNSDLTWSFTFRLQRKSL